MKKRITTILLAAVLIISLVPSLVFADDSFADIKDSKTKSSVDVLQMMGVIDGYDDGTYRPNEHLTRAQFAKMAIILMGEESQLSKYSNMTIFPDAKPSAWYFSYVNLAARGLGLIAGFPDGTFSPNSDITFGQAVTILIRLIGYSDEEVSGVWPYGHIALAKSLGMLSGLSNTNASGCISRADAAKLFVNTVIADAKGNGRVYQFSPECTLKSIDTGTLSMKTTAGTYPMLKSIGSNSMIGKTGYVVIRSGKALSFIPKATAQSSSDTAVILKSSSDVGSLTALAGRDDYTIIKNGIEITKDQIKRDDVAIYREDENKIILSDTKLCVYYENCSGSPANPSSITVLGGIEVEVLPSAAETISKYKPGEHMSLLLTADFRVAAVAPGSFNADSNNAAFIVSATGKLSLISGGDVIELPIVSSNAELFGRAARLSYASAEGPKFSALTSAGYGSLNTSSSRLGSRAIAANALVFQNGEKIALEQAKATNVVYARENQAGDIDMLVLYDANMGTLVAGYGETFDAPGESMYFDYMDHYLRVTGFDGDKVLKTNLYEDYKGYVAAIDNGNTFINVKKLGRIGEIPKAAFNAGSLISTSNGTYKLNDVVTCYNTDTHEWTSLEDALVYGRFFRLFADESTVYVMEYWY